MTRKIFAAACFVLSLGLHIAKLHGRLEYADPLVLPLSVCWVAFILPGMGFVGQFERHVLGYQPWDAEHNTMSSLCAFAIAALIWFFPVARIERWFGSYDAFSEGPRRRPLLVRGAANTLDALNKRLFGRQKTGGWA